MSLIGKVSQHMMPDANSTCDPIMISTVVQVTICPVPNKRTVQDSRSTPHRNKLFGLVTFGSRSRRAFLSWNANQ
ncbi:hypothetical protein E4U55_005113 [Claviceps digitariae]|nr:hypothetical protein E4U55_005113 [Claviceps digitariae]